MTLLDLETLELSEADTERAFGCEWYCTGVGVVIGAIVAVKLKCRTTWVGHGIMSC